MAAPEEGDFDPYEDEGEFSEDEEDPTYLKFLDKYELGKTIGTFAPLQQASLQAAERLLPAPSNSKPTRA